MAVDVSRLNKKLKELQKRYPDNTYEIVEGRKVKDKRTNKEHTLTSIEMKSGRRPHKTKEQMKLAREERARKAREEAD
jgi:hypothetical protein